MRSIRNQLLAMICGTTFGVFIIMGALASFYVNKYIEESVGEELRLVTDNACDEVNRILESSANSVDALNTYVSRTVDASLLAYNDDYRREYIKEMTYHCEELAKAAYKADAIFFRPDPNVYGGTTGVFLAVGGYGDFLSVRTTDILKYSADDKEHVGWYYEPWDKGKAVWMEPYLDKNLNATVLTYAVPVYAQGRKLGVVGMDIAFSEIRKILELADFRDGYVFMVNENGDLVYHPDYPEGMPELLLDDEMSEIVNFVSSESADDYKVGKFVINKVEYRVMRDNLSNGMYLAVAAPESVIMSPLTQMWERMAILFLFIVLLVLIVGAMVMLKIIKPIRALTDASTRISKGELNVAIEYTSNDEIGGLAKSIKMMAKEIRDYINYIHEEAYIDGLTELGNKTAYLEDVKVKNKRIEEGLASFGIFVFDVNGLKIINDNYGHEYGDDYIKRTARALQEVFGEEHTYRVGGDEFVAIIDKLTEESIEEYVTLFDEAVEKLNATSKKKDVELAVSKGAAIYDANLDEDFQSVFKRADMKMYEDKESFYSGNNDRRRERR